MRPQRWRWRCLLCPAFGYADSDEECTEEFERHYMAAHGKREHE